MIKKICQETKMRKNILHDENQYLNMIETIIEENNEFIGRNGKTLSIFGGVMHFDLTDNKLPLLTTKKLAYKTCLKELLWFISGNTSNKVLNNQNVHIWDGNSSRQYLDSIGLTEREEGDLGPIYGFQWRHFNANYDGCNNNYTNQGIDQISNIIEELKNPYTRNSRRLILTAWNPCQLKEMALPPCHILCQFNVTNNTKLSCSLYQRSGDLGLGVPFNIASYSFLTHLIAKICNLEAYEFIYNLGNVHIYDDHIINLKAQLSRIPYDFPSITINNNSSNIDDYKVEDFIIDNYKCHDSIKLLMRE